LGGARVSADTRAAIFSDQIFLAAAGTTPPAFIKLFSEKFFVPRGGARLDENISPLVRGF
jgi:hypothetical protein